MSAQRLTLIQFFAAYAVALVVMGALDGIWLGWLAKSFYQEQLGALMTDSVRVVPAGLYYFGFPLVIVYLALMPAASLGEACCAVQCSASQPSASTTSPTWQRCAATRC